MSSSYLPSLNPEQRQAVQTTEGPLLLFAGAGSGKTRVLVHRIAYIIQEKRVSPWNIFAVTFTNKAAGEMKARVGEILGRRADDTWISTFHSAGVRILRRHIESLGYGKSFVIYDDHDQQTLIKECLEELQINPKLFPPRSIQSRMDAAKNELIEWEEYPTNDFFSEKVAKVYEKYSNKLKQNNAVDFGDLLLLPVKLFRKFPQILAEYQQRLRYLMVDEYQDTNHAQYELIRLLSSLHQNLCVVGDDDQSIYRWRGADVRNILEFEKDFPNATVIKLEQNYRSTKNILKAAGEVVKPIRSRKEKTLWTDNSEGEKITVYSSLTDIEESRFVVQTIKKLQEEEQIPLSHFAIFYRTNAQSRIFEDELRKNNLPYLIFGGTRFYDRAEIKDMIAYLWVLANPQDSLHLRRIINVPTRGIGKTSVERLEKFATQTGIPVFEALGKGEEAGITPSASKGLKKFQQLMLNLQVLLSTEKLSQFVSTLMDRTGYIEALKNENTLESEGRLENLEEFVNVVADYENSNETPTLQGFLDQISLLSDIDSFEDRAQALPLMTLHLAKGLEFDTVFFVGMEEGLIPHVRSMDSEEEMDEERRLTYVGMTRAKKRLYISHAERRRVFGNEQYNLPSRFLGNIPGELTDPQEGMFGPVIREEKFDFNFTPRTNKEFILEDASNPYKIGTKVKHPIFGMGTIRGCEGNAENRKLTIAFHNGDLKKLVAKFSNLTILG